MKLATRGGEVLLRVATESDLGRVTELLVDDPVSAGRGDFSGTNQRDSVLAAFREISNDSRNVVLVVEQPGELVATMQLTLIPGLSRGGATRIQVEAVHVASTRQSSGIGTAMMRWVIESAAPACGVKVIQLTSDQRRADAHRFYRRLGFVDSHVGFKFIVPSD